MAERIVKQVRPRSKVPSLPKEIREKRVAAYARVSTDSDEQMGSVEAQKDYFEKLIREKPGWVLVGVYADVYNQRLIPFDTKKAVQTLKITAFEGKMPVESRYFYSLKL